MNSNSEKGIAMILALFMVMVLSVLSTSLMFVSQTETWASQNYRMASQTRYAGESGMHLASNYLMFTYVPPSTGGADDIVNYDITGSPVLFGGNPVVLSSNPDVASNYPVAAVATDFLATVVGNITLNDIPVTFNASATLLAMQEIVDAATGLNTTLQTWQIDAEGGITGARSAEVEVAVVLERQPFPLYSYAAFATAPGCGAISFAGGASTDSYDSSAGAPGVPPVPDPYGGNVGANGNLDAAGGTTTINGSVSTPRSGVGNCTTNNVTAATLKGATVTEGFTQLSQPIEFPAPPEPNPLPPTTPDNFIGAGCPGSVNPVVCTATGSGAILDPAANGGTITMGDVSLKGGAEIHLNAGTYVVNSLDFAGGSEIVIDSGPVIFKIAGKDGGGGDLATPVKMVGNSVSNDTYDPSNLQIFYSGPGELQLAGGSEAAMLVYAPNAEASLSGGLDFYGSLIVNQVTATGGTSIHYDRNLLNSAFTSSNYQMTSFNWKSF